jgi:hypothetical protein
MVLCFYAVNRKFSRALFTSGVFPPPRGLGMGGDLVNPSLSPYPQFSPNFPTYPLIFSYFAFSGMGGGGRGWERFENC